MKKAIIICLLLRLTVSHAQQPDLNLSFEKLDTNGMAIGWQADLNNPPVLDAYDGKYAIEIYTYYVNKPGHLKLGKNERKEPRGIPFAEKPKKLKGYYKYEYGDNCNGKDSAEVYIYLKKFNTLSKRTDTIGGGKLYLGPTSIYKLFEVPVIYNSQIDPDSLYIQFSSQRFDKTLICGVPENRYFTIDNLSLEYSTPTLEIKDALNVQIAPNPTNSHIKITWQNAATIVDAILLKDSLGRVVQKKAVNTEGVNLDLSNMPIGLYFIEFNQNGKHLATRKVVKQ